MTAALPRAASGARKDKDGEDEADAGKAERRDAKADDANRDDEKQRDATAEGSEKSGERTKDQNRDSNDRDETHERRDQRSGTDNESVSDESTDGGRRSVSRKQEANADDSGGDGGGNNRGGRGSEELAQERPRDDEPDPGDTTDDASPAPTVPSNPNIPVATTPDLTDADLFIEANPDVIASTSTSGGFAFARSGNVIAVSGPDGAQIIQTDDPDAVVTPSPTPDAPSDDGGNNDVDFSS